MGVGEEPDYYLLHRLKETSYFFLSNHLEEAPKLLCVSLCVLCLHFDPESGVSSKLEIQPAKITRR